MNMHFENFEKISQNILEFRNMKSRIFVNGREYSIFGESFCSYLLLDTVKHLAIPDFEFRRFPGETRVFFSKIYFLEVLL